ncbi:FHA domain-containing protein [Novosphingobium sp. G106]|uniref:type VI secretion system-associated FHA domain protein n=1 Tax=Novosphingobium sp. G106 TaxID=2849500 RepID=UPI001C2D055D|nr:type VI secretion system-associated FHA domain protein [Novosphingobium sp. G106]MBV1691099.1 FHA domain-containing protein [Novosphingobium sp. G106]
MNAIGAAAPPTTTGYELRLYHGAEPGRTIDTRHLREGSMTLGRDPGVDWVVDDPTRTLSRQHCELIVRDGDLAIRVSGANGAFAHDEKLPFGVEAGLAVPCTLALGDFRLAVCRIGDDPAAGGATTFSMPLSETAAANRSLLEAFCEGAGLDSSQLAGEDPDEIMRRVGAFYRQTVSGVSDLMAERDRARSLYDLQRTRIASTGNNLFKWASPKRLAVDLLLTEPAGFLSGPEAVRSSLRAIRRHLVASQAGMQGCLRVLVDRFSTGETDALARRSAELAEELEQAVPPSLEQAYVFAYEAAEVAARAHEL